MPLVSEPGSTANGPGGNQSPTDSGTVSNTGNVNPSGQVSATAATVHEMLVAVLIMGAFIMLLTIVGGTSKTAGNTITAFLALLLLVQGITHVNPFVAWVANHPLTPAQTPTQNGG